MEGLLPHIRDAHWTAFDGSPFIYFLELGSLPADWVILHQVVADWDETMQRFRSQGILLSFTSSWIHGDTFLLVVGCSVNKSIEETPLWNKYFKDRPWEKKKNKTGEKNEVLCGRKAKAVKKQKLFYPHLLSFVHIFLFCPLSIKSVQLSMIWLPSTKQTTSKYLFKSCRTLKSV